MEGKWIVGLAERKVLDGYLTALMQDVFALGELFQSWNENGDPNLFAPKEVSLLEWQEWLPKMVGIFTELDRVQRYVQQRVLESAGLVPRAVIGEVEVEVDDVEGVIEDAARVIVGEVREPGYVGLQPGTNEWMDYWKGHPEEQMGMLEWVARGKGRK